MLDFSIVLRQYDFAFNNIFKSEPFKPQNKIDIVKESIQIDKDMGKTTEQYEKQNKDLQPVQTTAKVDADPQISKPALITELPPTPQTTLKHTIVRVEQLSVAFDQGKIYVTVDQSSSNESMKLLCDKLKKDYKEFSNIIICLYADNTAGNNLARGMKSTLSTKEQSRAWLAMYSYNEVEGEYFDDSPGSYQGAY